MPEAIGTPNPQRQEEIKKDIIQKQLKQEQERLKKQGIVKKTN